jgi:outer membrane immunogenic protein
MKNALLGSMAALVLAAPALAADMSTPYFGPGLVQPGFGWAGVYLGAHAGYGWNSLQGGLDGQGGFGGGQIGYNYQMNIFVFGVEGDGAWANISQTGTLAPFGIPVAASFKNEALASLRGRFGVTINNVLFYATGGGGWAHSVISGTALASTASADAWQSGYSAGAGFEWAFVPRWSVKFEYLHYGLAGANFGALGNSGNAAIDTVKIGFNYLFH